MNKAEACPAELDGIAHEALLGVLARVAPERLKPFSEGLIVTLGEIEVVKNRTGLVMLPMRDTARGVAFHLGEVLVSEAHIRAGGQEGYGIRRGRDLEAAMAMALVDLAVALGKHHGEIAKFVTREEARQTAEDTGRLRAVEATRVEMETF